MNLSLNRPISFATMAKPIGSACNLNCTYCYYLEKQKLYTNGANLQMSDEVLENFIRQYIEAQQVPVVSFVWQGGEPTLRGIDFFKQVVKLQRKYAVTKHIENAFQTNGTNLNDEWCSFFKDHNFLVGISIDGPEKIHNKYRPYKTGKASFTDVMQGIDTLHKHRVDFNTLSVVNRESSLHPLMIYNFLKDIGSGFIQFLPVVEREAAIAAEQGLKLVHQAFKNGAKITEWSVIPEDYGSFLTTIFDEWVRRDVGKIFVQLFDVTLANWANVPPALCVFGETCGNAVVMEHNGDVYSCDHFVYPEYHLGNILSTPLAQIAGSNRQVTFGNSKRDTLPQYCIHCDYRFACNGECPKHRFMLTPDGEPGLSYLCNAYKEFFAHVHPYMQIMADELMAQRPPANVMEWACNN